MVESRTKLVGIMLPTGLACVGAIIYLSSRLTSSMVYLLILASIALVLCEYMCAKVFFSGQERTPFKLKGWPGIIATVAISVLIGALIEWGTLIGAPIASPLNLGDWNIWRLGLFSFMAFGGILFFYWYWADGKTGKARAEIRRIASETGPAIIIGAVVVFALCIAIGVFACDYTEYSPRAVIGLSVAVAFAAGSLVLFARQHGKHPEYAFAVIALAFGAYLAFVIPPITLVAWDDQVHYRNVSDLSYVVDAEMSDGEATIRVPHRSQNEENGYPSTLPRTADTPGATDYVWEDESIDTYTEYLDETVASSEVHPEGESAKQISYQSFGYISSAIALWIARLINLPFSVAFALARLFNLIAYVIIWFIAIRVIPVKKTIAAVIGLLPTELFLAASFSYDPAVASLIALAVALTIREIYEAETPLTVKRFVAISIAFIVGLGPKAIYFPLIAILFLMPRSKFPSVKRHSLFILATIVIALVTLCSFIVPFFVTSGGAGDMRGGSGVSPSGQMGFMLEHPNEALSIFSQFIFGDYLTPAASDKYTMFFAYLGSTKQLLPFMSCLPIAFILLIAIFDNFSKKHVGGIGGKIWVLALCFITVVLITLALYIDYTPVGLDTINGVQERYLVPLLLPLFAICTSFPFKNRMNQSLFAGIGLFGMALLMALTVFANVTMHIFA